MKIGLLGAFALSASGAFALENRDFSLNIPSGISLLTDGTASTLVRDLGIFNASKVPDVGPGIVDSSGECIYNLNDDGSLQTLVATDGIIFSFCEIDTHIVFCGDFKSFNGYKYPYFGVFDKKTQKVVQLHKNDLVKLSGNVNDIYCDGTHNVALLGGKFSLNGKERNAAQYSPGKGIQELPFVGLNGPVNTIAQIEDQSVLFGGSFSETISSSNIGDIQKKDLFGGDAAHIKPSKRDESRTSSREKVISEFPLPMRSGQISADGSDSDPSSIICANGASSADWYLKDSTSGSWSASFQFPFALNKIRLYNSHNDGTKTFSFVAYPLGGILNLTYVDSRSGKTHHCTADCSLPKGSDQPYRDFYFVNYVEMRSFTIFISEWYGIRAGLSGIQLFEDQLVIYADERLNQQCDNKAKVSSFKGNWAVNPGSSSSYPYMETFLGSSNVIPNLSYNFASLNTSGNVSLLLFTPGALEDRGVAVRGGLNVSVYFSPESEPASTTIWTTNNYDKYDPIYLGPMEAASKDFMPRVILRPLAVQNPGTQMVAQRIQLKVLTIEEDKNKKKNGASKDTIKSKKANGVFQYHLSELKKRMDKEVTKKISSLPSLNIQSIVQCGKDIYLGGRFEANDLNNIFRIDEQGNLKPLGKKGFNGAVNSLVCDASKLYIGGDFTGAVDDEISPATHLFATYDASTNNINWSANEVKGSVKRLSLVNFPDQMKMGTLERNFYSKFVVLHGSDLRIGDSKENNTHLFYSIPAGSENVVHGTFYSPNSWISTNTLTANSSKNLYSGKARSYDATRGSTFQVQGSPESENLLSRLYEPMPFKDFATLKYGRIPNTNKTYESLAGATASDIFGNGITFYDVTSTGDFSMQIVNQIKDLKSSKVKRLLTLEPYLIFGGQFTDGRSINGLGLYEIQRNALRVVQPGVPSSELSDNRAFYSDQLMEINAIHAVSRSSLLVSLEVPDGRPSICESICLYDILDNRWKNPSAVKVSGQIVNIVGASKNEVIVGGEFTLAGIKYYAAKLNVASRSWANLLGAHQLPGPVKSIHMQNYRSDSIFFAGRKSDTGEAYLVHWDGNHLNDLINGELGSRTQVEDLMTLEGTRRKRPTSFGTTTYLLVLGSLYDKDGHKFSGMVFDGERWYPYMHSSSAKPEQMLGSGTRIVRNWLDPWIPPYRIYLARGFVVLIGLAISLGLTMILTAVGGVFSWLRERKQTYDRAPSFLIMEKNFQNLPPEEFLRDMSKTLHDDM